MATNYSITRDTIIITALRKLGVVEPGDTPATMDQSILSNAQVNFNLMVKQWATKGLKLWTTPTIILPLVNGQTQYIIGPTGPDLITDKPLKIIQAYLRNTSISPQTDVTVTILSEQEYNMLGSKYSSGVTNSIFLKPGTTSSTLNVYLTPDATTATNYDLYMVVQRPIQDLPVGADAALNDWPNEWFNTLMWNLADDLAMEYPVTDSKRNEIAARAKLYRDELEDWDTEATPTFFQPDYRQQYQGYRP